MSGGHLERGPGKVWSGAWGGAHLQGSWARRPVRGVALLPREPHVRASLWVQVVKNSHPLGGRGRDRGRMCALLCMVLPPGQPLLSALCQPCLSEPRWFGSPGPQASPRLHPGSHPALLTSPAPTCQLGLTCSVLPLTPSCPPPCSPTPAGRFLLPGPADPRSGWWTPWGMLSLSLLTPGSSLHAWYVLVLIWCSSSGRGLLSIRSACLPAPFSARSPQGHLELSRPEGPAEGSPGWGLREGLPGLQPGSGPVPSGPGGHGVRTGVVHTFQCPQHRAPRGPPEAAAFTHASIALLPGLLSLPLFLLRAWAQPFALRVGSRKKGPRGKDLQAACADPAVELGAPGGGGRQLLFPWSCGFWTHVPSRPRSPLLTPRRVSLLIWCCVPVGARWDPGLGTWLCFGAGGAPEELGGGGPLGPRSQAGRGLSEGSLNPRVEGLPWALSGRRPTERLWRAPPTPDAWSALPAWLWPLSSASGTDLWQQQWGTAVQCLLFVT